MFLIIVSLFLKKKKERSGSNLVSERGGENLQVRAIFSRCTSFKLLWVFGFRE
jgi:hypothetical protein